MKIIKFNEVSFIPASHEDPINPSVMKKILFDKQDLIVGQVMMVNWALLDSKKEFQLHYHQDMDEVFVIVNGLAIMTIDSKEYQLSPGDAILVNAGEKHKMKNISNDPVNYIVFGISKSQGGKTITVF